MRKQHLRGGICFKHRMKVREFLTHKKDSLSVHCPCVWVDVHPSKTLFFGDVCGYEEYNECFCRWIIPSVKKRGPGNYDNWGNREIRVDGLCALDCGRES